MSFMFRDRGKKFLSDSHEEGGTVSWRGKTGQESWDNSLFEGEVRLTDCSKAIYLEFNCHRYKDIQKRLDKVDVLLEELNKFKGTLLEAQRVHKPKSLYY